MTTLPPDVDHGTPITQALNRLLAAKLIAPEDHAALLPPPDGVRTLGDLATVLQRGELDKALAAKLRKVLGGL